MYTLVRTDSSDPDFIKLVAALDTELAIYNGEQNQFYSHHIEVKAVPHSF